MRKDGEKRKVAQQVATPLFAVLILLIGRRADQSKKKVKQQEHSHQNRNQHSFYAPGFS
jgi:hypothetical protein